MLNLTVSYFDKSVVSFSKSTLSSMQASICSLLAVRQEECHTRYLGLPSFMPRNRGGHLHFIQDCIWSHLQGWKGKLFSVGGKEVLLKSVIQAILCYSMNYFRLPKSLIHDIQMMMARFWWGGREDERRLHWVSWKHM